MAILGAVLAGGASRRFGSDKALALLDGVTMLERSIASLAIQTNEVVVCGGDRAGIVSLADQPAQGLGPLAGLCAALDHARQYGFDAVLSVPVDTHPLPNDLVHRLGQGPAAFAEQHLIGIWPAALRDDLANFLALRERAVRKWIEVCECRLVAEHNLEFVNLNMPLNSV